jgi:hypothetical protein
VRPMVGSQVFPIVVHLASILSGIVAAPPMMLAIGLNVSSIMSEILTIVVQVSPILMKLCLIGLVPFILPRMLRVSPNHVFVLLKILPVGPAVLRVTREVPAFIMQLALIFTKILLVVLPPAPCLSRFRGSPTKFGFGEDGLSGGRSAAEHGYRHTHLYDVSVPHDRCPLVGA